MVQARVRITSKLKLVEGLCILLYGFMSKLLLRERALLLALEILNISQNI